LIKTVLYIHILSATAWVGGSLLLFALGILLRDKDAQKNVYAHLGPIYGYFETGALVLILISGITMINHNGLIMIVLDSTVHNTVIDALRIKLMIVAVIIVLTVIHFVISMITLHKVKTPMQRFLSKTSSMGIFILNLFVLHYAMVIRDIL